MIWLTWRQLRVQAVVVAAAAVALGIVLLLSGMALDDLRAGLGDSFVQMLAADGVRTTVYTTGFVATLCLPAIIGVFWGAPLVARELEAGTHRLAWNQSVTRTRWLAVKLAVTGGTAMAATALLSLLLHWWCGPIDAAVAQGQGGPGIYSVARMEPMMFDARGIVPVGFTAFAFALGVAVGLVARRTVLAMAITLAIYVAVQVAMPPLVRAHLGPEQLTTTITDQNLRGINVTSFGETGRPRGPVRDIMIRIDSPGAWIIANESINSAGEVVDELPAWVATCVAPPPGVPGERQRAPEGDPGCFVRLAEAGYRQRVTYHPASSYWTLQAYETAIFLGLAGLLAAFSFWWLRRRVT